jgi:prepilin-type processing-associated H-X9-DG protein
VDGTNNGSTNLSSDYATLLLGTVMGKTAGGTTYGDIVGTNGGTTQKMFACPAGIESPSNKTGRVLHYGAHPRLMPDIDASDPSLPASLPLQQRLLKPYKIAQIKQSAEIALVWDALQLLSNADDGNCLSVQNGVDQDGFYRTDTTGGHTWNNLLNSKRPDGTAVNLDQAVFTSNKDWTGTPPAPGYYPAFAFADIRWRHGKNDLANFIFADGHADSRRLKVGKDAEFKLRNLYVNAVR